MALGAPGGMAVRTNPTNHRRPGEATPASEVATARAALAGTADYYHRSSRTVPLATGGLGELPGETTARDECT